MIDSNRTVAYHPRRNWMPVVLTACGLILFFLCIFAAYSIGVNRGHDEERHPERTLIEDHGAGSPY